MAFRRGFFFTMADIWNIHSFAKHNGRARVITFPAEFWQNKIIRFSLAMHWFGLKQLFAVNFLKYKSSLHSQLSPLIWRNAIHAQNVCSTPPPLSCHNWLMYLYQLKGNDCPSLNNSTKHWNVIHVVFFSCQVRFTKAAASEGHPTEVKAVSSRTGGKIPIDWINYTTI